MKRFLNILTTIAAIVFACSLCAIESLNTATLAALMISGGWLVCYTMIYHELRKAGEW